MQRLIVWVAAALFFVLGVGLALLPLETPAFTQILSSRFSRADEAGLTPSQAADVAEQVRAFVISGEGALPSTLEGRPAFDAAMVSHLADVRDVIASAHVLIVTLALGAIALGIVLWRSGRAGLLGAAMTRAGVLLIGMVVLLGTIALIDFDGFFTAFHQLFFAEGTWTFPYDSLLIRLFPEGFWASAAVFWGVAIVAVGALAWLLGRAIVRRSETASKEVAD